MIYVVATLTIKPETRADFIAGATACIGETRKEPGNIAYDLHESVTDPTKMVFVEQWENADALVPHRAAAMYALVEDIERYPDFLPWCSGATVLVRDPHQTVATIEVDFWGVRQRFTTANAKQPPERIELRLVRGPFRDFRGEWRFTDLGEAGSKVELSLAYELANPILARLAGPVFDHIASTFVDVFVRRAAALRSG